MERSALRADLMLLLAAAVWGAGFIAQKLGMDHVGPMLFTGLRLLIAAIILLPVAHLRASRARASRRLPASRDISQALYPGDIPAPTPQAPSPIPNTPNPKPLAPAFGPLLLISCVLLAAFSAQQIGIQHTTASKAGFITALYVVFTPIVALIARQRALAHVWIAAAISMLGLMLLSINPSEPASVQLGDAIVLLAAILWAVHVVMLSWLAPTCDPVRLAMDQFFLAGVGAVAISLFVEPNTLAGMWSGRWAILYAGVFATALAFTIQIVAQRTAPASHVAILLSLEAVFAAIFAAILLRERLTPLEWIGAGVMLAGALYSQLARPRARAKPPLPAESAIHARP